MITPKNEILDTGRQVWYNKGVVREQSPTEPETKNLIGLIK